MEHIILVAVFAVLTLASTGSVIYACYKIGKGETDFIPMVVFCGILTFAFALMLGSFAK
jgi:hypothetical protein